MSGLSNPEEVKRIREAFVAGKEGKAGDLVRMTLQTRSPETVRRLRGAFSAGKEKAGGETAAKVETPEKPSKVVDVLKPAEREALDEATAALKAETHGWGDRMREFKIPGAETLKKFSTKELVEKLGGKKIFGRPALDLLVSAGTGAGVRTTFRYGLGALTGGWGYVLGSAMGAVSGALVDGALSHHREIERQKGLKDEEFERFLQEARGKNEKLAGKIDLYLDYERIKNEAPEAISEDRQKIREFLENKFARIAYRNGAIRGAMIGAIGGFAGAFLSDWVTTKLGWKIPGAENLAEARKAAKSAGGEALRQQIEAAATEASGKAYENAIKAGVMTLDAESFSVLAERGDGATHIARRLIHDYIVERQALLGKNFVLPDKAELVYAEDYLRRELFKGVAPERHKMYQATGQKIAEALGNAYGLTGEETANLNKNWVIWNKSTGRGIRADTWKAMLDYKMLNFQGNNFSKEILEKAKSGAASAAKRAGAEAAKALATPPSSPAASEAAESWFKTSWLKWGLGAAGGALALGAGLKYHEAIASGAGRMGRSFARSTGRAGKDVAIIGRELGEFGREMTQPLRGLAQIGSPIAKGLRESLRRSAEKRGESLRKIAEARVARETDEEQGPAVDVEAQRLEAEKAQIAEAARLEAARTEKERVEHEKKLAADPVRKLFQEFGQTVKPGDFEYKVPSKEALEAGSGKVLSFDNYPDFCEYVRSLSHKQRVEAESWKVTMAKGTKLETSGPALAIWANKNFNDKHKANPELERRYNEMYPKIIKGLLADEYRSLPEKEDPQYAIEPLMDELKAKFKGESFSFYRRSDSEIPLEEEVEGLRKLSRALERVRIQGAWSRHLFGFMIGKRGVNIDSYGNLLIEIDPSLSEEELGRYILTALPKVDELATLSGENYVKRRQIGVEHSLYVAPTDYEKVSPLDEAAALSILEKALIEFPVDTLLKPSISLKIGFDGTQNLGGEVRIAIPPDLSVTEMRRYLTAQSEEAKKILGIT